jgi:hypothetical protein
MQFDVRNFPALPGEAQNPTRPVSAEKLLQPLSGSAFAPRLNDEFVFDVYDENGNVAAVEQDITNSTYVAVNIACTRNGKPSWLGQGQLVRLDADMKPTCPLCEQMRAIGTVGDLLEKIKGKKIKVVEMVEKEFTTFGTTTRVKRPTPVFEFVD